MWRFWLALDKPDDELLNRFCEWASEQRKLAQFIRDGLRLIGTLREGRIDVLIEMFPFVQQALAADVKPHSSDSGGTDRRLERIEQLLLENSQGTAYQMGGFKPVALKKVAASSFDDDLDTLILEKSTATVSVSSNYLAGLGGLLGEDFQ
jgi:hypothetical protein